MRTDKNALLTFDKINGLLNKNFSVSSNPAILDLGCSDGQLLSIFKAKGYNNLTGAGYDVKAQNNIKIFLKIDFNDLSWSDALKDYKFDVIVSSDVIEHLLNPYNFLTQIKKILKADGVIIFSFPNVHNLRSRIAYLVEGRFCGFFGRNWNSNHMLFDQHI